MLTMRTPATILRQRAAGRKDRLKRSVTTWTPVTLTVCDQQQVTAREVTNEEGTAVRVEWLFFLPAADPVESRDRLLVGGLTYQIESVDRPGRPGAAPHHTEVLARRVS